MADFIHDHDIIYSTTSLPRGWGGPRTRDRWHDALSFDQYSTIYIKEYNVRRVLHSAIHFLPLVLGVWSPIQLFFGLTLRSAL
ncbi:hypothetical protein BDW69DRAFT_128517 [Aspergillus filifer]